MGMKVFLMELATDFNDFSELVALNRAQLGEGECDIAFLEWNRGQLHRIETYLKDLAKSNGAKLVWECKEHEFVCGERKRRLEYKTVSINLTPAALIP